MESPNGVKGVTVRRAPNGSAQQLHPAMKANQWQKGQSGNPTGQSGLYGETLRIARQNSPAAMQKPADLMECGDPRVEAVAANALLDRGWGKPKDYDPGREQSSGVPVFDPRQVTPAQLEVIRQAMLLLRAASATVEVMDE